MCGRFALTIPSKKTLAEMFNLPKVPELAPQYNIAPSQEIAAVAETAHGRALSRFTWGIVPPWNDSNSPGNAIINVRSETAHRKRIFRDAFLKRRCIIPASGFYEWKKVGRRKIPYFTAPADQAFFGFAGIWEPPGKAPGGLPAAAILTGPPNRTLHEIHSRMPVILFPEDYDQWLDPDVQDPDDLRAVLKIYPDLGVTCRQVSPRVNSTHNDDRACIRPAEPAAEEEQTMFGDMENG